MKSIYDLDFLISLIFLRGKRKGKEDMGRFRIAKTASRFLVNSETISILESVFIYRYGPYVLKFEDALADLIRRNILEIMIDDKGRTRFCLTDDGQRWIMSRLRDENYRITPELGREIDRYIFAPIPDLIMEIAEKSPLLHPIKRGIGNKQLIRVFDWRNTGDGKVHGYHYTLLRSFYRLEDYFAEEFNQALARIEGGEDEYRHRIVDYSTIPEVITSEHLFKDKKEKHTMRYIFNKNDPKSIKEDKFEGKNYIGNLWYIYNAVNIIHILASIAPTIDEIARICLTLYEYAMEQDIPFPEIRRMRESAIRPDIHKLTRFELFNKKKIGRYHVYTIRAKKIIDTSTSDIYLLLGEDRIRHLYNEKVRPSDQNMSIIRRIISDERKLQETAQVAGG